MSSLKAGIGPVHAHSLRTEKYLLRWQEIAHRLHSILQLLIKCLDFRRLRKFATLAWWYRSARSQARSNCFQARADSGVRWRHLYIT